jgi:two-component system response regulator GlrR
VVLTTHSRITPELLLLREPETSAPSAPSELKPLKEAREAFERAYLVRVLTATKGNVSRAAELAGRYRAEFYKLLRKHGLEAGAFKDTPPSP